MDDVVVVGAGLAGLRSAEALRAAGFTGRVTVVGAEDLPPYNRPPLSKKALTDAVPLERLVFPQRAQTADVRWLLGTRVASADLAGGTLTTSTGDRLGFDGLVVATGLRPRRLELPGPADGRCALRTHADAMALGARLTPGSQVVVIGGGLVGTEVAWTALKAGCRVALVMPEPVPLLRAFGAEVGAAVTRPHLARGLDLHSGALPIAWLGSDHVTGVALDDGTELPADVVVEAVGSVPEVGWLAGNGLDLHDGVLAGNDLAVTGPVRGVVAVGDVVRHPNPRFDDVPRRVEHWGSVAAQSVQAARTLLGEPGPEFAPLPTVWTEQGGVRLDGAGLPSLADEWRLVSGSWDGGPFLAVGLREEEPVAVLGVDAVREVARRGREIGAGRLAATAV